jgi:streptogramin lyase
MSEVNPRLTLTIQRLLRQQSRWRVGTISAHQVNADGTTSVDVTVGDGGVITSLILTPNLQIKPNTPVVVLRQGTDSMAIPLQSIAGSLWVTDLGGSVWKVSTTGVGIQYPLNEDARPRGICLGPDGNFWIADVGGAIWRVTPQGVATEFNLGEIFLYQGPGNICVGPDGNLWSASSGGYVWVTTTAGESIYYTLGGTFQGICAGPDGNLWVTDNLSDDPELVSYVWKVTTSGSATQYPLAVGAAPIGICVGPDNNLWVADQSGAFWKVTTGGVAVRYAGEELLNICKGPNGNLWASSPAVGVAESTTGGSVSQFAFGASLAIGICSGP